MTIDTIISNELINIIPFKYLKLDPNNPDDFDEDDFDEDELDDDDDDYFEDEPLEAKHSICM